MQAADQRPFVAQRALGITRRERIDERLRAHRTILSVTHRLNSVTSADRILVMRGGTIVAELDGKTATQEQVMHAASGAGEVHAA